MRKSLLLSLILIFAAIQSHAQVDNYALSFSGNGSVTCGELVQMEQQSNYTLQFWMCPATWIEGATIFSSGDDFSATLGTEGSIVFTVGDTSLTASAPTEITTGQWTQVTLICSDGAAKVFLNANTTESAAGSLAAIPLTTSDLVIGENYNGRLDEMRFWKTALTDEFDYFRHTTLNQFNPEWSNLVAYYKMDQELCDNLVDYKSVYTNDVNYNYHGTLIGDAKKEKVDDNDRLPYLLNGAYTADERFFDRSIPREQYLLSNDLIILGIQSYSDGHLRYCTPTNTGTLENCERLDEYEGRSGVLSLGGDGKMSVGKNALILNEDENGKATGGYAFECWLYLDEWTEGAYLFRKENEDGTQGLSIRLGAEDTKQVFVRVDGRDYGHAGKMKVGEWMHFAIVSRTASSPGQLFGFVYNGTMSLGKNSLSDSVADNKPTNTTQFEAYIGEGIKGKMDDIMLFNNRPYNTDQLAKDMAGDFMMPGLSKTVTAEVMQCYNSLWRFDKADEPGYDTYSQDEWLAIMKAAYNGYRGYQTRISVKSHTGWLTTIGTEENRKTFAADLAELSKPYDGVELDLEWAESSSQWAKVGYLADEIRAALPEGKKFMISVHGYTYSFPKAKMSKVDGFTVQQYGGQSYWFKYSNFVSTLKSIKNYGYPKNKIYGSYSTTTSGPYSGDTQVGWAIAGVRWGLIGDDFVPDAEMDSWTNSEGYTYYFDGPLQTYERAKYIQENNMQGIFYWDMGNDLPVEHKYNFAKWCSYALNANVDTLITHVDVKPYDPAGIGEMRYDATDKVMSGSVSVFNTMGQLVCIAPSKEKALAMLPRARVYIIKGRNRYGNVVSEKVNK